MFTPQTKYDKDAIIEKAIECDIDDISFLPNVNHLHQHLFEESGELEKNTVFLSSTC